MTSLVHVAFFSDEPALRRAIDACRAQGLHVDDVWSPHPIHGLDELLGLRRSRLPVLCFAGAVAGLAAGLGLEYWASAVSWPLDVGGKPFDSFPAFVPVAFELLILLAGLCTVAGLLVRNHLWPGRRARARMAPTTDDRYALVVRAPDGSVREGAVRRVWLEHGAHDAFDVPAEEWR